MNTADSKIHYPTITTHNLAHLSSPYKTPQSRHRKMVPRHQDFWPFPLSMLYWWLDGMFNWLETFKEWKELLANRVRFFTLSRNFMISRLSPSFSKCTNLSVLSINSNEQKNSGTLHLENPASTSNGVSIWSAGTSTNRYATALVSWTKSATFSLGYLATPSWANFLKNYWSKVMRTSLILFISSRAILR